MKKKVILIVSLVSIVVFLASCSNVPTFSGNIPPDPVGVSEPTAWGNEVNMSVSPDKSLSLTPLTLRDSDKIRVSFLNYTPSSELSEENFEVFEDGKAQGFLLRKVSSVTKKVDIVFVVDITGSMSEEITGVKNSIVSFINDLESSGLDVKVAVVPFSDEVPPTDSYYVSDWLNLSNLEDASEFVKTLRANGGGDTPENSFGAIMFSWNNVSWRGRSQRIIVLLTDAFSHYKGDGGSFDPKYTKSEVISALSGYATLYMVASTGNGYNSWDTDYSSPGDPRQIAVETGGFVVYQSGSEEVDLSSIGIGGSILSSYVILFESDSPSGTHTISVYYDGPEGLQGYSSVQMNY